ncbi:MAG: hypothetical protein P4M09_06585 [Devosia sp.]|nr:hypothetical protein [Devosia sp.]
MDSIAADMVFAPVDGLELTDVPDGRVVYQADRERVHFLNPTAVIVFELCGEKLSVGAIETFLKDAFDLSEVPATGVRDCIRSLLDEKLLRPLTP